MNENQIKILSGFGLFSLGLVIGGCFGYFFDKKKLQAEYSRISKEEIASVKEHYSKFRKEGPYNSPTKIVEQKYGDKISDLDYDTVDKEDEPHVNDEGLVVDEHGVPLYDLNASEGTVTPVRDGLTEWERQERGYHEPPSERDPYNPYVISALEFMDEMEGEFDKITITYFEGDNTLCDERDEILDDIEGLVGSDSLSQFGVKSDDPNVVYVRNEKLKIDFEIVLDPQNYGEIVGGFREKKDNPGFRKFREED